MATIWTLKHCAMRRQPRIFHFRNFYLSLFRLSMKQLITKQLCPFLRYEILSDNPSLCRGRQQPCFECQSHPGNPEKWDTLKCRPNDNLMSHQVCSKGWLIVTCLLVFLLSQSYKIKLKLSWWKFKGLLVNIFWSNFEQKISGYIQRWF